MAVLTEGQRRGLEKAVQRARDVAEDGARAAIKSLAVHASEPFSSLSPEARKLRIRLRAHARQLGDARHPRTGEHDIEHLVVECAYEHWHRMIFARFLAENQVLMHPDGVPVTLEECHELAPSEGAADGWELAARYAAEMLPQIFRPESPIFEIGLPPETSRALERLVAELSPQIFTASDSLGWVYQFWQAKKKADVNRSEVKIGADELPAVTQLFTEPYMVQFLLHNTLGAWWVGRHGQDSLPVEMPFLRWLDYGTPAAGMFDGWPETSSELRVLDPCCGSGHFLVAAFEILVRFRMSEEGLEPAEACDEVLRDNLHGLEIDERCTQIAAFALGLAAWTFPGAGGYRVLPEMHIASTGLAPRAEKEDWLALAGDDVMAQNGMERLYELFLDAPVLGSLIDPTTVGLSGKQGELGVAPFEALRSLLDAALAGKEALPDAGRYEMGVTVKGIAAAAEILGSDFTLITTNVPYLSRGKQAPRLAEFCETHYDQAKHDLATVFLDRMMRQLARGGTAAAVLPLSWTFNKRYEKLRRRSLQSWSWSILGRLGPNAFETIPGEVVSVGLFAMTSQDPANAHELSAIDASAGANGSTKAALLCNAEVIRLEQVKQLANPDARIVIEAGGAQSTRLEDYASSVEGLTTADMPRYIVKFWELPEQTPLWERFIQNVDETTLYGGRSDLIRWEGSNGSLHSSVTAHNFPSEVMNGRKILGQLGVRVTQMGSFACTIYTGEIFGKNAATVVPHEPGNLAAVWCFMRSPSYHTAVRELDQSLKVTNATLAKVEFDLEHWTRVAHEEYPTGLPEPHSADPAQWVFRGVVQASTDPLQVAVARLLGYRWPEQAEDGLDDLVDADGIVCLPAVRGEQPAAVRIHGILGRAFGKDWSARKLAELLEAVAGKGWTLERWLGERFFRQHCQVFQQRPFIWHIWDGLKTGGFGALVNYHKLDRKLLETLTYNYLGDWIRRQQDGAKRGEDGAEERLVAARGLQDRLKRILEGEAPYDIFVRWKPIETQPMGWAPDIDDGVRINIRPFMSVEDVGKKGAGVLRDKPNINWSKDRGKDPAGSPWSDKFGGDRINAHHLKLAEKRAARTDEGAA